MGTRYLERFLGFAEQYDRVAVLVAGQVVEETVITEGNGDLEFPLKAARLVLHSIKKHSCHDKFVASIAIGTPDTSCAIMKNEKLPLAFGRLLMFVLRIFRFPWLRSEIEIRSEETCPYQYHRTNRIVCLNPHHYQVVVPPAPELPPVLINKQHDYNIPTHRELFPTLPPGAKVSDIPMLEKIPDLTDWKCIPNVLMSGDEMRIKFEELAGVSPTQIGFQSPKGDPGDLSSNCSTPNPRSVAFDESYVDSDMEDMVNVNDNHGNNLNNVGGNVGGKVKPKTEPVSTDSDPDDVKPVGQQVLYNRRRFAAYISKHIGMKIDVDAMDDIPFTPTMTKREMRAQLQLINVYKTTPMVEEMRAATRKRFYSKIAGNSTGEDDDIIRAKVAEGIYELVPYEEPEDWLTIGYYEEEMQLVKPREVRGPYFLIDGFTCSAMDKDHRLSIGYVNNVNRKAKINAMRTVVSRGVRLYYLGGEVYLEVLGDFPVYVQSLNANFEHGFHLNTVSRIQQGCNMKIFNNQLFAQQLAYAADKNYQEVYTLSRMCTFRFGFLKGWGDSYKRDSVLTAPMWIEAHLNGPMRWIDRVLNSMGQPPQICSTFT